MAKELNGQGTIFKRYRKDVEPDSPRDGLTLATASEEIVYDPDVFAKIEELITEVAKEASLATIQTILNNLATEETLDSVSKDASVLALTTLLTQRLTGVIATENSLNSLNNKIPSQVNSKLPVDVSFPTNQPVTFPSSQPVSIDNFPSGFTVGGVVGVNNFPNSFNIGNFPATQPVSLSTIPFNNSAASETTLSAINGKFASLGQKTTANSAPVTLPSDLLFLPTRLVNGSGGALDTGSGTLSTSTLRVVQASDGPTITSLNNLLSATTLATPTTQTLTYTVTTASRTSDYIKLVGRISTIFIPSTLLGTSLIIRQRRVDGSGTGFPISSSDAVSRSIVLDQNDRTIDAESVGWLVGAIGSEIAFEVQGTDQTSSQSIYVKVLV